MSAAMMMRSQVQAFSCQQSRKSVVVRAEGRSSSSIVERIQLTAVTIATASLLAAPANAGVVIEQPKLRKLLFDDTETPIIPRPKMELQGLTKRAPSTAAAPSPSAAPEKKEVEESTGAKLDLDPLALGVLALPGAIGAIAAGAFALSKVDGGFVDFIREASVRDSNNYAGYEPVLKPDSGPITFKGLNGTKKVKAGGPKRVTTVVKKSGVTKPGVVTEGTGFSLPKLPTLPTLPNPFQSKDD